MATFTKVLHQVQSSSGFRLGKWWILRHSVFVKLGISSTLILILYVGMEGKVTNHAPTKIISLKTHLHLQTNNFATLSFCKVATIRQLRVTFYSVLKPAIKSSVKSVDSESLAKTHSCAKLENRFPYNTLSFTQEKDWKVFYHKARIDGAVMKECNTPSRHVHPLYLSWCTK